MNNKGVTLEGLVITILVLIILASIAIFSGFDTVNHANTAKFVQEFADYESAVNHQFYIKSQVLAFEGNITPVDQVFAMVAGNSNSIEIPKELRGKLQGTKAYPIDVPEIDGIKTDRFGGKTYVTDIGEVFIDPEYAHIDEESEDGVIKKYANSKIVFYVKPPKPAIQDVIKVGDWIEFDTTASTETLTFTEAQTGVTTNPPLVVASTTTNWRVWKNNGDGTIDIIPGDQPVYRLTLNGEPGYDNSLDIFNAIVGAFANNSKYLSTEANGRMPTEIGRAHV